MSKLIEHLKSFNRKERFILLKETLGSDTFQLSADFRKRLKDCLGLGFEIPDCAYVAMDYHIGWIQMAVHLNGHDVPEKPIRSRKGIEGVNDNQRDVDLLVAFTRDSITHLILIEAKADTSWDYDQLDRKVKKLKEISPDPNHLELHLVLMSPKAPNPPIPVRKSTRMAVSEWPKWMKKEDDSLYHIPLCLARCLLKITRCKNDEKKTPYKEGKYYRIDHIAKPANSRSHLR